MHFRTLVYYSGQSIPGERYAGASATTARRRTASPPGVLV